MSKVGQDITIDGDALTVLTKAGDDFGDMLFEFAVRRAQKRGDTTVRMEDVKAEAQWLANMFRQVQQLPGPFSEVDTSDFLNFLDKVAEQTDA